MKLRDGQVSNSSSSVYILLTTKENFERALKEATPLEKAVAKKVRGSGTRKLLGRNMVQFVVHGSDEPTFMGWASSMPKKFFKDVEPSEEEDDCEYEGRCDEKVESAWESFVGSLLKNKDETFSIYQST